MSGGGYRVFRAGSLSLRWQPRLVMISVALVLIATLLGLLLLGTGTLPLTPAEVMAALTGRAESPAAGQVVMRIRLPRLATAALVGASLGMAGAIFQSISRNPLGSPDVIGFTTGAATGAIVQIILFNAAPASVALAAVAAGMATAAAVFLLSLRAGSTGGQRLVLVGLGLGATLSGVNTMLLVMGDLHQAMAAQVWLAGSLNMRTWAHVLPAALGLALIAPVALWHAHRLNMIEMGDDMARQLGVRLETTRLVAILAAVGLCAIATATAGPIAFIALAAPQLARRLAGTAGLPLPASALMGAVLLLTADLFSQRFSRDLVLPIGMTTGLLGGLYILWLLTRRGGR